MPGRGRAAEHRTLRWEYVVSLRSMRPSWRPLARGWEIQLLERNRDGVWSHAVREERSNCRRAAHRRPCRTALLERLPLDRAARYRVEPARRRRRDLGESGRRHFRERSRPWWRRHRREASPRLCDLGPYLVACCAVDLGPSPV